MNEILVVSGFGSRGDVLPLLITVHIILNQMKPSRIFKIHLITNADYKVLCDRLVQKFPLSFSVDLIEKGTILTNDDINSGDFYDTSPLIQKIKSLLDCGNQIFYMITNLFAMEAWVMSIALNICCTVIHPTPSFETPLIASVKHDALNFLKSIAPNLFSSNSLSNVTWHDYSLWLWPWLIDSDLNKQTIRHIYAIADAYSNTTVAAGLEMLLFFHVTYSCVV